MKNVPQVKISGENMAHEWRHYKARFILLCFTVFVASGFFSEVFSYPIKFTDSQGQLITIEKEPVTVVSLVPSITEVIFKIGAGHVVKGVTYCDNYPRFKSDTITVGGFLYPSIERIHAIGPEIVFISRLHKGLMKSLLARGYVPIDLEATKVSDIFRVVELLGKIFSKEQEAERIAIGMKEKLNITAKKISVIPEIKRKRVIRLMGGDEAMVPGDDSFQNEYIRLAGGIPPNLDKIGDIVSISKEEWVRFNPQIIYCCSQDRQMVKEIMRRPGWNEVEAIKTGRIFYFPCDLICQASINAGDFVMWLSSRIYSGEFSRREDLVMNKQKYTSKSIDIALDYVKSASVLYGSIHDFPNKALVIDFTRPLSLISTLEGNRNGVETVGNNNFFPAFWQIGENIGLQEITEYICRFADRLKKNSSFLFTGVTMDSLAVKRESFKDMEVYAIVTAGVTSNAVRMSADEGMFYELGTINIILLPNVRLTGRAMQRAIISATEAKTAALQDLDIRSKYSPLYHQATGTGTDNIIVVEGSGKDIDNAGGHSKMGELIARAVYSAVSEGISKQNGIVSKRDIFQRLEEREITMFRLINLAGLKDYKNKKGLAIALEELLLNPRYASFLELSLSISDEYEKKLISDLTTYEAFCKQIAEDISGNHISFIDTFMSGESMPLVPRMAFNAIFNGIFNSEGFSR